MGAGAAMTRIENVRRILPSCWFNEGSTEGGRDALGWYHEKRDENRGIGLGPAHDWASHGSDAFGLMAVDHATHLASSEWSTKLNYKTLATA
jgi:phage terminase large subunit